MQKFNIIFISYSTIVQMDRLGGYVRVRVVVFNATFNNISIILWRSVLLVEEILSFQRKLLTCRKSLMS
jgi:hypothetical protein